jgi:hypothetical protein
LASRTTLLEPGLSRQRSIRESAKGSLLHLRFRQHLKPTVLHRPVEPTIAFFYLLAVKGFPAGGSGGFFGFVMANGNPNRQPGFMQASFLLNTLPLYALAGVVFLRRGWLVALWAGWRLHILEDFLTHVTDAYAPLYPFFPEWRPRGLVSYWDPRYGAEAFQVVQIAAAGLILAWIVGKRLWLSRKT